MGMRMKRVRLGGAKVVTDFFITFYLRVPQATVEVVLIRVMNGVAWFFEVDCVEETFHMIWHADETGPHRQSAGGGGFIFKHLVA